MKKLILKFINQNIPVLIEGPVGSGKTATIQQIAEENDYRLITIILSLFDPVDLKGIPAIVDGKTVWLTPDFWPTMGDKPCIINFDEIDRAGKTQRDAILTLLYGGTLGEYKLPDNCRIVACCNGQFDTGTATLTAANNNRFAHLTMIPTLDRFKSYALTHNLDTRITSYLDYKPDALYMSEIPRGLKAFPSPRTWEMVSDMLPACDDPDEMLDVVTALIGAEHGITFTAFCNIASSIPDVVAIVTNPDTTQVPDSMDERFFMTGVLSAIVKKDMAHFSAITTYAKRLGKECEIVTMTNIVKHDPLLKETGTYTTWLLANKEIF